MTTPAQLNSLRLGAAERRPITNVSPCYYELVCRLKGSSVVLGIDQRRPLIPSGTVGGANGRPTAHHIVGWWSEDGNQWCALRKD